MLPSIDILFNSPIAEELNDNEIKLIWAILDVHDYRAGEVIATSCDSVPDNLYLLVSGSIEVRVRSKEGLNSFRVINPGELANVLAFTGGTITGVCTSLHAEDDTRVLSLRRSRFEKLIFTHPSVVYRFSLGLIRYIHRVMRLLNTDLIKLEEKIVCPGMLCRMV